MGFDPAVIIAALAQKAPWVMAGLSAMGFFAAVVPPLQAAVDKWVKATPSQSDDAAVAKVESSKGYQLLLKILGYVTQIKL
jgi:hypothetical protein